MRVRLACTVYGDWHVDQFIRHGIPSLRAPGNMPDLDAVLAVHTRPADAQRIAPALAGLSAVELTADVSEGIAAGNFNVGVSEQNRGSQIELDRATANGELWALSSPDTIWGEGALSRYVELMTAGAAMVVPALLRVDASRTGTITDFGPAHMAKLALEYEHLNGRLYHSDSPLFPKHAELAIWPVPNGFVLRTFSAEALVCNPRRASVNPRNWLVMAPADENSIAVIGGSDEAIVLSMAPPDKAKDWLIKGAGRLRPQVVREFVQRYWSPVTKAVARRSYRLAAGDVPESAWAEAERQAAAFVAAVFAGV
jgi:hypothetical protein